MINKIRNWLKYHVTMRERKCVLLCRCGEVLNDGKQDPVRVTSSIVEHTCPRCGCQGSFDFGQPFSTSARFVTKNHTAILTLPWVN